MFKNCFEQGVLTKTFSLAFSMFTSSSPFKKNSALAEDYSRPFSQIMPLPGFSSKGDKEIRLLTRRRTKYREQKVYITLIQFRTIKCEKSFIFARFL